jgi:hypothetical protein
LYTGGASLAPACEEPSASAGRAGFGIAAGAQAAKPPDIFKISLRVSLLFISFSLSFSRRKITIETSLPNAFTHSIQYQVLCKLWGIGLFLMDEPNNGANFIAKWR